MGTTVRCTRSPGTRTRRRSGPQSRSPRLSRLSQQASPGRRGATLSQPPRAPPVRSLVVWWVVLSASWSSWACPFGSGACKVGCEGSRNERMKASVTARTISRTPAAPRGRQQAQAISRPAIISNRQSVHSMVRRIQSSGSSKQCSSPRLRYQHTPRRRLTPQMLWTGARGRRSVRRLNPPTSLLRCLLANPTRRASSPRTLALLLPLHPPRAPFTHRSTAIHGRIEGRLS